MYPALTKTPNQRLSDRSHVFWQNNRMTGLRDAKKAQVRQALYEAALTQFRTSGYEDASIADICKAAGVAKGTFFAHFSDKDALLATMIGADMAGALAQIATAPAPRNVDQMIALLHPLMEIMTESRTSFDVILRHSGVGIISEISPIAECFGQMIEVFGQWFNPASNHPYRRDIGPELLSEGLQAFLVQALALKFCSLHNAVPANERLATYLRAWVLPAT